MNTQEQSNKDKLLVIWSSGDREVALKITFMYTRASRKNEWWDQIRLVIWGPSARLLAQDEELQAHIHHMKELGIELLACKACTDSYGVSEALEKMGVQVIYMGEPLTAMLKEGWTSITF